MSVDLATDPDTWVERHGDVLYRYALLRLRSSHLAADVVQETYVEALRSRSSFTGRSSEQTWLIGILRHKIVDYLRKVGREPTVQEGLSVEGPRESLFDHRGRWRVGPASWGSEPARQIETREFWDAFSQCLSKLPQGVADAFFLRELDDLRADEVQQALGITPANFWKRLHRARSLLRQCLESGWFNPRTKSSTLS
jgi:RNA polymerase sigma-70 factor (ECF subfamily)